MGRYPKLHPLLPLSSGPADPETCLMHSPVVHGQNGRRVTFSCVIFCLGAVALTRDEQGSAAEVEYIFKFKHVTSYHLVLIHQLITNQSINFPFFCGRPHWLLQYS